MKVTVINVLMCVMVLRGETVIKKARRLNEEAELSEKDEDMFNYDGLDHNHEADAEEKETISFSEFRKIMETGKTINHFYNVAIGLEEDDEDTDDYVALTEMRVKHFEITSKLFTDLVEKDQELADEVHDFYKKIRKIEMTTADAIDFFSFREIFSQKQNKVDLRSEAYKQSFEKIETIVYNYSEQMREFFTSVNYIRNFEQFLLDNTEGLEEKFAEVEEANTLTQIETGVEVISELLSVGSKFAKLFDKIERSIEVAETFRLDLYHAIDDLKFLDPEYRGSVGEGSNASIHSAIGFVITTLLINLIK